MPTQTSEQLNPYVKVKGFISQSPFLGTTRNILLAGHVIDTAPVIAAGTSLYTPIEVGQITSKASAVSVCASLGLTYKFLTYNTLDLANTDEIAAMLIQAGMQYEDYIPSLPRYTLQPCNFYVGILGDDTTNTKTLDPWGDVTTSSDLLSNIDIHQTKIDLFGCPYEYITGDATTAGNYFEQLKSFAEARTNGGNPSLGHNWVLFSNITTKPDEPANFDNLVFEGCSLFSYPYDGTLYSAPSVVGAMSVRMIGMQQPFNGINNELVPNFPIATDPEYIYSDDQANTALQSGWSPIRVNTTTNVVYASRIVSCLLEDPVTEVARDFLLDYQDFKIFYLSILRTYNSLITQGIVNDRFTVNINGTSPILNQVKATALAVDQQLFLENMVAVPPKFYSEEYEALLDSEDINRIIASKPLYPSSIIFQIDMDVTAKNFVPIVKRFNILTS